MRAKTRIMIFFFILSFSSCNTPSNFVLVHKNGKINQDDTFSHCERTYKFIKDNWYIDREEHCFRYNKKLINRIEEDKSCFTNLSNLEIINLFGEPQHNEKNAMTYYMDKSCDKQNLPPLYFIRFYKNWKSDLPIITSIQIGKIILEE